VQNAIVRIRMEYLLPVFLFFPLFLPAQTAGNRNAESAGVENPVTAAPVWERDLEGIASGLPFLQAESVVLAIDGGRIKSYSRQGTFLWDFDPRSSVTPYVARSPEGTSYVCNSTGSFMAINRVGRELWRLDLVKPITFPVVIGWDGRVFIPVENELSCRTASGFALWRQDMGNPMSLAPVADHAGGLVTVLENRDFLRVDQFGAMERIRLDRIPAIIVPLKSGDRNTYFLMYANGEAEGISLDMAASKGSKLTRFRLPSLQAAPVAAAGLGDQVAVTLRDGRVMLLGSGGQVRWSGNSHETTAEKGAGNVTSQQTSMIFDERGIYMISTKGATAFAANGRRRWLLKIPEAAGVPGFSDEGLLYVCGKDRRLYTYQVDNRPRNIPRSMYGPDPEGSYGLGNPPPSPWINSPNRFAEQELAAMYESIDSATRRGQVGENETAYVGYLMEMTGGILNTPHYSPVRPPIRVPQRVELIRLLARMGSRETIPFLANLFYRDPEPSIKAACAEAIGRIGVDPRGDAIRAFSVFLSPDNANRDPMTLMSAVAASAALCRFSGPPLAIAGIRLLNAFGHMDFPPVVKRQAQQELNALRKEGLDKPLE
jgi:outer membrane protein assembly factor BamB